MAAAVLFTLMDGCADESLIENMLDGPSSEDPAAVRPSETAGDTAQSFLHHASSCHGFGLHVMPDAHYLPASALMICFHDWCCGCCDCDILHSSCSWKHLFKLGIGMSFAGLVCSASSRL